MADAFADLGVSMTEDLTTEQSDALAEDTSYLAAVAFVLYAVEIDEASGEESLFGDYLSGLFPSDS